MLKKLFGLFNGKIGNKWGKKGIENGQIWAENGLKMSFKWA